MHKELVMLADVSSDSPSERMMSSANIHTFGSSPPVRFWLIIYTAYVAPQLFVILSACQLVGDIGVVTAILYK